MENWRPTKEENNLESRREGLKNLATEVFNKITYYPQEIRGNSKESSGIQFVARVIGSRNILIERVKNPSPAAEFFSVEKGVRTQIQGHYTSGESRNIEEFFFDGSISKKYGEEELWVSTSGLTGAEDFVCSAILQAHLSEEKAWDVINKLREDLCVDEKNLEGSEEKIEGILGEIFPVEIFKKDSYLNKLLSEY